MRISDWSSDVCSSDLIEHRPVFGQSAEGRPRQADRAPRGQCAAQDQSGSARMNRLWTLKSVVLAGAGFALTSLAFLSAGGGHSAHAQAPANSNGNAPVDMAANPLPVQARADRAILTGHGAATQAGLS